MIHPDLTRPLPRAIGTARAVALLLFAAGAVACTSDARHVGNEPLGDRRPYPTTAGGPASPGSPAAKDDGGRHVDAPTLLGVVGAGIYHRADCDRLEGVPEKDRVPFLSGYDGLDAGYFPCDHCKPGS